MRHPIFARLFARIVPGEVRRGGGEHRARMLAGLSGRVIEVGAGVGSNFEFYPPEVTEVLAVEPEPYLRARAEEAAQEARVGVRVVDGLADGLPAEDGSFDAGVASLVLCSVPNQGSALAELHRVISPGGELRFYEHVRASEPKLVARQERADRWFWPRVSGGCHCSRDTARAIEEAGFRFETIERFDYEPSRLARIVSPHILGLARRP